MPIYPYVCTACGHEFDALQKISDDALTECPQCGESGLRKRLTAPAFQLKGTGWYETDFKHGAKGRQSTKTDKGSDGKDTDSSGADKKEQAGKSQSEPKSDSGTDKTKSSYKGTSSGGGSKPAAAAGGKDD